MSNPYMVQATGQHGGWLPLTSLMTFPRLARLRMSSVDVLAAARACPCLTVDPEGTRVRRRVRLFAGQVPAE